MPYLICYDITSPRRLKKVAKVLESYGLRIQKSFFQADIDNDMLKQMVDKLKKEMDKDKDSLFIYYICEKCMNKIESDGTGQLLILEDFKIL